MSTHRHVRTARLTLAATTTADLTAMFLTAMFELHSDPNVWHPPSRQHRHLAQTAQFLQEQEREWADDGLGYWGARALTNLTNLTNGPQRERSSVSAGAPVDTARSGTSTTG